MERLWIKWSINLDLGIIQARIEYFQYELQHKLPTGHFYQVVYDIDRGLWNQPGAPRTRLKIGREIETIGQIVDSYQASTHVLRSKVVKA